MSGSESADRREWRGPTARTLSPRALAVGVAVLVSLDQAAKMWVQQNVPLRARLPLVGDALWLVHYANHGAVGGWGRDLPWLVPALIVASLVLIVALLVGYRLYSTCLGASWRGQGFVVLAVAALLSTMLDRVRLGYVIDFLHVPGYPVFNFGDLLPHIGAVFLALEVVVVAKRR